MFSSSLYETDFKRLIFKSVGFTIEITGQKGENWGEM